MRSKNQIEITEQNFETEVMQARLPTLVDFGAAWCPPCRVLAPVVEAVAEAYTGRLRVATCDVDAQPALARRFAVHSLPTLILFHRGGAIARLTGAVPRAKVEQLIQASLAQSA